MPPIVALFLSLGISVWLFQKDRRIRSGTWTLLLPALWIAIQGSRPISYWLSGGNASVGDKPIDTLFFAVLIIGAVLLLNRQGFSWGIFAAHNKPLLAIYLYFLLSSLWSDIPPLTAKRLLKDFGGVLMALLLIAGRDPLGAIRLTYVRLAYVLLPLSLVFIKYFPAIGRQPTMAGDNMFRGVASHKNSLGVLVFILGLFLVWDLLQMLRERPYSQQKARVRIAVAILLLDVYLLVLCKSKTSLVCFALGCSLIWLLKKLKPLPKGKACLASILIFGFLLGALDNTLHLSARVAVLLGKSPDFTGRRDIWHAILEQEPNPFLGEGFYIFWDIEKGKAVKEALITLSSAHNGYLEVFVDGGFVGVALLLLFLFHTGVRTINHAFKGYPSGEVGLAFWATAIVYNLSESSFFRLDIFWLALILVSLELPRKEPADTLVQGFTDPADVDSPVPLRGLAALIHPANLIHESISENGTGRLPA